MKKIKLKALVLSLTIFCAGCGTPSVDPVSSVLPDPTPSATPMADPALIPELLKDEIPKPTGGIVDVEDTLHTQAPETVIRIDERRKDASYLYLPYEDENYRYRLDIPFWSPAEKFDGGVYFKRDSRAEGKDDRAILFITHYDYFNKPDSFQFPVMDYEKEDIETYWKDVAVQLFRTKIESAMESQPYIHLKDYKITPSIYYDGEYPSVLLNGDVVIDFGDGNDYHRHVVGNFVMGQEIPILTFFVDMTKNQTQSEYLETLNKEMAATFVDAPPYHDPDKQDSDEQSTDAQDPDSQEDKNISSSAKSISETENIPEIQYVRYPCWRGNFSIDIPESWTIRQEFGKNFVVKRISDSKSPDSDAMLSIAFMENLELDVKDSFEQLFGKEYTNLLHSAYGKLYESRTLSFDSYTVNGYPAVQFTGTIDFGEENHEDKKSVQCFGYAVKGRTHTILISAVDFSSSQTGLEELKAITDHIAASFDDSYTEEENNDLKCAALYF